MSDSPIDFVAGAALRLLPRLIEALQSGLSEEEVAERLSANRQGMDKAFDAAADRIATPIDQDDIETLP